MKSREFFEQLPIWIERKSLVFGLFLMSIFIFSASRTYAQITDIEYLVDRLDADEIFTRQVAIEKLAEIGEPAFPYLAATLRQDRPIARSSAIRVLQKIGHSAIPILSLAVKDPVLKEQKDSVLGIWTDSVPDTQKEAIESLRDFGFSVIIVPLLTHENSNVRRNLVYALGEMSKSTSSRTEGFRDVVPALVQALGDQNVEVQLHAIGALGKMGASARVYKDILQKMYSKFQFNIPVEFGGELEEGSEFMLPFAIPLDLVADLDLGSAIPPVLLEQFTLLGIPISNQATLATQKKYKSWKIRDDRNKQIYTLKRNNESIEIHRVSISRNLQIALEEKGLYVSRKARIDRVVPKNVWLLVDRNQIYTIERKSNPQRIDFSLNHEDPEIRAAIVKALAQILDPSEIGEYLLKMLDDPNRSVIGAAAASLPKARGEDREKIIRKLIARLGSKMPRSRFYAAVALGKMKAHSATDELLKMLQEGGNHVAVAADALGNILGQELDETGRDKIVGILVDALTHENFLIRLSVVEALKKIGSSAGNKSKLLITKNLIGLLNDSNLQVRQNVALTLGKIREPVDLIVSQLIVVALKDPNVRSVAIAALGEIGYEAEKAIPTVKDALYDLSGKVRASAVQTIVRISPQSSAEDDVLSQVRRILDQDTNEDAKAAAALALADFHRLNIRAMNQKRINIIFSALVRSLGDPSQKVQVGAIEAIKKLGPTVTPTLLDAQQSTNHRIVRNSAIVLAYIGTRHSLEWGRTVLQALFRLSADKKAEYHRKIIDLLKGFDELAKLNFLKEKLGDEIIDVRIHATYLLGQVKEPSNEIIPILVQVLKNADPYSVEDSRVFAETHRALLNFKMAEADEALIKERVRAWQRRKTQRQQKAVAEVP